MNGEKCIFMPVSYIIHMKNIVCMAVVLFTLLFYQCSSSGVKEKINKVGDVTGQVVGEFATGVSKGVEKTLNASISLSDNLKKQGLNVGKITFGNDSIGVDNILTVYIIFAQDFKGRITAKAFEQDGLEIGRAKKDITGKKDDAGYFEFRFDKRTNIDNHSKIVIE
jgi:hypothetical protein